MLHRRQFLGVSALFSAAVAAPGIAWAKIHRHEEDKLNQEVENLYDERFDHNIGGPNILMTDILMDQDGHHLGSICVEKTPAMKVIGPASQVGDVSNRYRVCTVFIVLGVTGTPFQEPIERELRAEHTDLRMAIRSCLKVRDLAIESGRWSKEVDASVRSRCYRRVGQDHYILLEPPISVSSRFRCRNISMFRGTRFVVPITNMHQRRSS